MQDEGDDRPEVVAAAGTQPVVDALRESMVGQAEMAYRRDRLLAWLALTAGAALVT